MVLAERNTDLVRNGRRSRGPSPNGQGTSSAGAGSAGAGGGTPENSSDDDNSMKRNGKKVKQSEYEEKIRVGRDYQAVCPSLVPEPDRRPDVMNDRALLVWSPTKDIPDTKLEDYIAVAKEKYGYNGEQALGMLFWHKHDLERAILDLANFTPFPDEWSQEDKVLFDQAFQFHGKSFHRIRQMLPDKSIASLVKYYYSWKKTRHRQSVMDRQEKVKTSKEGSENGSENGSNEESDEDKNEVNILTANQINSSNTNNSNIDATAAVFNTSASMSHKKIASTVNELDNENIDSSSNNHTTANACNNNFTGGFNSSAGGCNNCGVACNFLCNSPDGKLCASCYDHWRRTGSKRPTSGPLLSKRHADRNKRKPPHGMNINHDELVILAGDKGSNILADADKLFKSLQTQVQLEKQNSSMVIMKKMKFTIDDVPPENVNRINTRWNHDETMLAVQLIRKYGRDFQAVSDALGSKTEGHVRHFVSNNRRRFNLDQIFQKFDDELKSHEKEAVNAENRIKILVQKPKSETSDSSNQNKTNSTDTGDDMQIDIGNHQLDLPSTKKKC